MPFADGEIFDIGMFDRVDYLPSCARV